ncbi:MAG: hypothetical protein HYZ42_02350 [Bacteroidetes bacterium]|nr:hypothetical protein [Bacteroidota bacterium]
MSETENSINYMLAFEQSTEESKGYISFQLISSAHILLKIFKSDREVRMFANELLNAGEHRFSIDFASLGSGEYLVKLMVNTSEALDIESKLINIK